MYQNTSDNTENLEQGQRENLRQWDRAEVVDYTGLGE